MTSRNIMNGKDEKVPFCCNQSESRFSEKIPDGGLGGCSKQSAPEVNSNDLIKNLLRCEILKIGNFKLKSGSFSPIYIDLRRIISYPHVIKDLAKAIRTKQIEENLKTDVVCGVPYTALPIASVFSILYNVPMVMKRKEAKDYGTKKMVEGNICPGNSCLIIEDIVSTGSSIVETAEALRKEGLKVQECIVVVNRNQVSSETLRKAEIKLYPLFDIKSVFDVYCSVNRVEAELIEQVMNYFRDTAQVTNHINIGNL